MVKSVVGANWGDEGKGKMTDLLAAESDIVVRYQGGGNAGHTIINEKGRFALHLLPSGVCYDHITNVLAAGIALDLERFFSEYDSLAAAGIHPKVLVSDRAQLMMPYHVLFDQLEEERLGAKSFGSTKSGIAPFYSDKYLKIGFQVCELFEPERFRARLKEVLDYKNIILGAVYHRPPLDADEIFETMTAYAARLRPMAADTALYLQRAIADGKKVLLEAQLGAMRDPDNGIYPYVTSSSPIAGFGCVGAGIPPRSIEQIVAVVKAYSSCVGAGSFVTELFGDEAQELRDRGGDRGEYGATTGRPRRVGWLDLVATRYGVRMQGATHVALTLIDALGYLDKIPVCTGYEIDGTVVGEFPSTPSLDRAKPVYTVLDGWKCDIRGAKRWEDLPENARRYVEFIENAVGVRIAYLSTGPRREDIIYR